MISPRMPTSIEPVAALSDLSLRSILTPTHYLLATKVPLPEADREQWCMRLDTAVRAVNQIQERLAIADAWANGTQEGELVLDGMSYRGADAVQIRQDLFHRSAADVAHVLSIAALLVLDERAAIKRAANPVTCAQPLEPVPVDRVLPKPAQLPESPIVAEIRRERGIEHMHQNGR